MSENENEQETPYEPPEGAPVDDDPDELPVDPEPESTPEPEPTPEPTPQQDEERQEAFKRIDASFKTFTRNVEKQLADEITDWLFCPLCASGAVPGYVNRHDLGRVPEEVVANVQMFLGFARETEYESAPGITTCTDCGGLGKVSTGSRVMEHMTITCPTCKGYGYVPPPGGRASVHGENGTQEAAVREALADLETPERDAWGEPRVLPDGTLNDNYGKMPQFKTVHPVYGVTANLTPEDLVTG